MQHGVVIFLWFRKLQRSGLLRVRNGPHLTALPDFFLLFPTSGSRRRLRRAAALRRWGCTRVGSSDVPSVTRTLPIRHACHEIRSHGSQTGRLSYRCIILYTPWNFLHPNFVVSAARFPICPRFRNPHYVIPDTHNDTKTSARNSYTHVHNEHPK